MKRSHIPMIEPSTNKPVTPIYRKSPLCPPGAGGCGGCDTCGGKPK